MTLTALLAIDGCGDEKPGTVFRANEWHFQMTVPAMWHETKVTDSPPALGKRDDFGWKSSKPVVGYADAQGPVMFVYAVHSNTKSEYVLEGLMGQPQNRTTVDAEPNRPEFHRELVDGTTAFTVDEAATFYPTVVPRLVFRDFGAYAYAFVLKDARARSDFDYTVGSLRFFNDVNEKVSGVGHRVSGPNQHPAPITQYLRRVG